MSLEALAAAQQIGAELSQPVYAAVLIGNEIQSAGSQVGRSYELAKVHAVEHELLAEYTADGLHQRR